MLSIEQLITEKKQSLSKGRTLESRYKDRENNIALYKKRERLYKRAGVKPLSPVSLPASINELILFLSNTNNTTYTITGKTFLKHTTLLIESPFIEAKQKMIGGLAPNNKLINSQLKFLKGRLAKIKGLNPTDTNIYLTFIDRSIELKALVKIIEQAFTQVIDEGFNFKRTKRYTLLSATIKSNSSADSLYGMMLASMNKPSSKFKRVDGKYNTRRIRRYSHMIVLSLDKRNGRLVGIDRYKKKELPLYLQDD